MPPKCPYCREAIAEADSRACPACNTPHHADCWSENGGCTVFGCTAAPPEDVKSAGAPPPIPPSLPPPIPVLDERTKNFFADLLHDRRELLRDLLFVGLVAMPLGGLVGAVLGSVAGFVCAIFGGGFGCIFRFPMTCLCFGQAVGIGAGFVMVAALGKSFVALLRNKVQSLAWFVFDRTITDEIENDSRNSENPRL